MNDITREELLRELEKPNGAQQVLKRGLNEGRLCDLAVKLFVDEGEASALLARMAKGAMLNRMRGDACLKASLLSGLEGENAKLRRNCARLLGALGEKEDVNSLISALNKEARAYVRPSLVLAIGAIGGETAYEFLSEYSVPATGDETERKHREAEREALFTARENCISHKKHKFSGLDGEYEVELVAAERLAKVLVDEMQDMGLDCLVQKGNGVRLKTSDYDGLFQLRCFKEALFPIANGIACRAETIAHKASEFVVPFMQKTHCGEPPYRYRIEIEGELDEKPKLKKAVRALLDSEQLINSPSDYEIEIRICAEYNASRLYLKLHTHRDERFLYRKNAVPASIQPSLAHSVLRLAMEHLTVNARVIDPCCGSGTMLFERGMLSPCASLTGVDIAHRAVAAARENALIATEKYSITPAKFIVNDILRFESHRPYDELICNLPFGNRVGNHSSCVELYTGLLERIPKLVKSGGVAVLYTMEFTLLKRLIRESCKLEFIKQERTEAGGLAPMIFIVRVL